MVKIFYGNGECEVQGSETVMFCELIVKYPIEITDKSPEGFMINAKNTKIIIARYSVNLNNPLKEMFSYVGDLNIIKAVVLNIDGSREWPQVKRVMDYTELLQTNAEDMTTLSEDLNSKHLYGEKVKTMKVFPLYIENLLAQDNNKYLQNGSIYNGYYHQRREDGRQYTGRIHDENSLPLYFKDKHEGDEADELIVTGFDSIRKTRRWKTHRRTIRKKSK